MSKLSSRGTDALRQGLSQIDNENYVEAVISMDQLHSSDPNSWEACFYPGYANALEAAQKFENQPTRIGSVVSLLMEGLTKQVMVLHPRMKDVMDYVAKDIKDEEERQHALSEIVSRTRVLIDLGGNVLRETFKFRKEFRDELNEGSGIISGIKNAIENSSEKNDFRELCSAVSALGYSLGDQIERIAPKEASTFYNQLLVGIWQQSTAIDYEFDPEGDVRTKYIAKIKALDPTAKVGGETRELMKKIQAVVILIAIAVGAFFFFDVPGRIGEFFSSFGDTSDEAIVEKFAAASSGRFTIKGEVIDWEDNWISDDEIRLLVQNSKRKLNVVCKIDKLPQLRKGQWLTVKGKKVGGSTVEVIEWSNYTPKGNEPKYGEQKSASADNTTQVQAGTAPTITESRATAETAAAVQTEAPAAPPATEEAKTPVSDNATPQVSSASLSDNTPVESSQSNSSGDASLDTFRKYVKEMHDSAHDKDWHDKYQGQSLTLRAKMKKVKVKKGDTIVECSIDGENVVVYMQKRQADKALSLSKGDMFTVRGNIAKQRWGILHTMGLSEGEIVE